jgi:hypothetical protein
MVGVGILLQLCLLSGTSGNGIIPTEHNRQDDLAAIEVVAAAVDSVVTIAAEDSRPAAASDGHRPSFHGDTDFHHHYGAVKHPGLPEPAPVLTAANPVEPSGDGRHTAVAGRPMPARLSGAHIDLDFHHVHGASRVEHAQPLLHLDERPDVLYPLVRPTAALSDKGGLLKLVLRSRSL